MRFGFIYLFLLLSLIAKSQPQIEGFIIDAIKKTPLPGTKVFLFKYEYDTAIKKISRHYGFGLYPENTRDTIYRKTHQVFSDSSGYYSISNLEPGIYKLRLFI